MREKLEMGVKMNEQSTQIVKDMEKLMVKIIDGNIPRREELSRNHTLKDPIMKFWGGAHLIVVKDEEDIFHYGPHCNDQYIISKNAYEVSWTLCEIRDIYIKNDFYDFELKFGLFGTFAEYYKKRQKECNKTNCLTEKKILLGAIQEMIYSDKPFLPSDEVLEIINTINYFEEIDELTQKDVDTHIGAES